jgi:hypothetical protein
MGTIPVRYSIPQAEQMVWSVELGKGPEVVAALQASLGARGGRQKRVDGRRLVRARVNKDLNLPHLTNNHFTS